MWPQMRTTHLAPSLMFTTIFGQLLKEEMKKMKSSIAICAIVLFAAGSASAVFTVYNNRPGWESAVGTYAEEFFTDATLNPGVSVVSTYPGYIDTVKGVWWDKLVVPGQTYRQDVSGQDVPASTTTWQFAAPIVGFGGNWDLANPEDPGAGIAVSVGGVLIDKIPNTYAGEFWGFVSTDPFSSVLLKSGLDWYDNVMWAETYELDNMVYSAPIPAPGAVLLGSIGVSLVGWLRRRRAL